MMNIERANQLFEKFKDGVSHDPKKGLNDVLAWQDVIGKSSMAEISAFEDALTQEERKHFVWINFLTLSQEMAVDILLHTVIKRKTERIVNKYVAESEERENELYKREVTLRDSKKAIYKRLESSNVLKLKEKIKRLEAQNKRLQSQIVDAGIRDRDRGVQLHKAQEKSFRFDQLKELLSI